MYQPNGFGVANNMLPPHHLNNGMPIYSHNMFPHDILPNQDFSDNTLNNDVFNEFRKSQYNNDGYKKVNNTMDFAKHLVGDYTPIVDSPILDIQRQILTEKGTSKKVMPKSDEPPKSEPNKDIYKPVREERDMLSDYRVYIPPPDDGYAHINGDRCRQCNQTPCCCPPPCQCGMMPCCCPPPCNMGPPLIRCGPGGFGIDRYPDPCLVCACNPCFCPCDNCLCNPCVCVCETCTYNPCQCQQQLQMVAEIKPEAVKITTDVKPESVQITETVKSARVNSVRTPYELLCKSECPQQKIVFVLNGPK